VNGTKLNTYDFVVFYQIHARKKVKYIVIFINSVLFNIIDLLVKPVSHI